MTALHRQVRELRRGGHVLRCHTMPHHGEYSNGKHSFDALSLLLLLHPNPSTDLIKVVLWHDMGERALGDVPSPAKRMFRTLKRIYEVAENEVLRKLGVPIDQLSTGEKRWVAAVDALELWLWTLDQDAMGNKMTKNIKRDIEKTLTAATWLPQPCKDFYDTYTWTPGEELVDVS